VIVEIILFMREKYYLPLKFSIFVMLVVV